MREQRLSGLRLRKPERGQLGWVAQCADDLVGANHPVRSVAAVVEQLDVSGFYEPIKARAGVSGRDSTDPQLLVGLWLYGCIRGVGSARELARRCEESAPFLWLCGGVTVNHRLLSDFRTDHGAALDALFTQVIASLVDKDIVKVSRISQDGVRVRVSAGASSFRREERLQELLSQAREHVEQLRQQVDGGVAAELSARQKAARKKSAEQRLARLEQAVAQLPELQQKQAEAERRAGKGKHGEKIRQRQPRVSTTDPEARRMKMPNGGFNPAVNVQLATDTSSRAIVGVDVTSEGTDSVGLSTPMRQQVEQRTGKTVQQHLIDGGYLRKDDIENAGEVDLFVPPKPAKSAAKRGRELEPKRGDSPAVLRWKKRMASPEGKEIYKLRAATSETANADLRTHRGLTQMTIRGAAKMRCVALWCALAYNIFHFAQNLLGRA
ncbi:transposase [Granulicella sp. S156]|uniref:transposase n=1 Tax=Granulicella sp. S156 TaxID=1747224 RepID=UPI00131DBC10|nr:transposase [Granulicella sp. S156]